MVIDIKIIIKQLKTHTNMHLVAIIVIIIIIAIDFVLLNSFHNVTCYINSL
jgi:hypothetical protein